MAYTLVWLPGFDRFVVTASADGTDAFGYSDFALGTSARTGLGGRRPRTFSCATGGRVRELGPSPLGVPVRQRVHPRSGVDGLAGRGLGGARERVEEEAEEDEPEGEDEEEATDEDGHRRSSA